MQWRLVALVGILGLSAGWGLGDRIGAAREARNQQERAAGPRPLGVEVPVAPRAQELRLRLQRPVEAPSPTRNPFVFGGRTARPSASLSGGTVAPGNAASDAAATDADAVLVPNPGPVLSLSGIATERSGEAAVLTAMISDGQTLHFVKAGDALPGGYTVVAVSATQVTLRDASGDTTLKLK
ncbi:MAG: hypothetical protein IT178_09515 [Acidobacteria bacterium]|nr:hypothetical protein [Acidobacteriota bacterium]